MAVACAVGAASVTGAFVAVQAVDRPADVAVADAPVGTLPTGGTGSSSAADRSAVRPPLAVVAEKAADQATAAAADLRAQEIKAAKKAREKAERKQRIEDAKDDPRGAALAMFGDFGWDSSQMPCLDALWTRESGWNYQAENPSSGAYGIPQSLPGSKMATVADDWRDNPLTQIRWGLQYIQASYGTPCGADAHSQDVGHY